MVITMIRLSWQPKPSKLNIGNVCHECFSKEPSLRVVIDPKLPITLSQECEEKVILCCISKIYVQ